MLGLALVLAAAPAQLDWKDFWAIAGVARDDKQQAIIEKWGQPDEIKERGGVTLRYRSGPSVILREDGATQLDFASYSAKKFIAEHPSPVLELVDLPCHHAARRLKFAKAVGGYTSCKQYECSGWFLDVTLMCSNGRISTLVVVWLPVPELKTMEPLPPDHC